MKLTLIALSCLSLTFQTALSAPPPKHIAQRGSEAYENAAKPLREKGSHDYRFKKAKLADVVTLIADEAELSYICLLGSQEAGEHLVTFSFSGTSPFRSLESLAKHYPMTMIYDEGFWVFSDNEPLIRSEDAKVVAPVGNTDKSRAKTLSTFGLGGLKTDWPRLKGIRVGNDIVVSRDAVLYSKLKFDNEPKIEVDAEVSSSLTLDAPVESLAEELSVEKPKR